MAVAWISSKTEHQASFQIEVKNIIDIWVTDVTEYQAEFQANSKTSQKGCSQLYMNIL